MKTVYITEEQKHKLSLLTEDKATDTLKKYIRTTCSDYLKQYLDTNINQLPQQLSETLKNVDTVLFGKCQEQNANLMMFLRLHFLKEFDILYGKGPVKFIIGLARIGLGELGFYSNTNNQSDIALLKQLVLFADSNEEVKQSLDANLNGLSFQELKVLLNNKRKEFNHQMRLKLGDNLTTGGNYKVIPINSSEEAEQYAKYFPNITSERWCITTGSFSSYATNGSRFYFCLKNGFENVHRKIGPGCPLDEYGLSMVSVLIDMDGEPTRITTRWNHANDGENNENLHTAKQVQEVLGIPFYQTFKPYTREELHAKGIVLFDEVQELLDSGKKPKEIFDNCSNFSEGFAWVQLNDKCNFINGEGKIVSSQWFDDCCGFIEGFAAVRLNDKWNFINREGKIISSQWFDDYDNFSEGFVRVQLNDKCNFINGEGKILSSQWFDDCSYFIEGFARVQLNDKWNFISREGKILSSQWFDWCDDFREGFARVYLNDKSYKIDREGRLYNEDGSPLSESKKNRRTVYITEEQKHKLGLILEDKEGKNLAKARRYLEVNGYNNSQQRQQILDSIRTDIPNSRLQQCKFILGVVRLYINGELNDGQSIAALNKTLKYIASDTHVNEYDNNLNNESLQTLVNRFKGVAKDDLQQSMAASNARQFTVNESYRIVPIDTPKEAAKYGKYTSWCVTHNSNMYDSYTNNGIGRFYFCLRNGFEKEPKVEGEGCPLDSYGLSMIAVSVTMEGEVNTITCRWNHDMNGNDNIMTIEQLEDLLGRNFYQTFKPYTREELHAKGIVLFDEVQGLLDSGKKPEEIFDDCYDFREGFAVVILNGKYNYINRECKIVSSQWFDSCDDFREGFARVQLNGKCNFISGEGKIISSQWFDWCDNFSEGFGKVKLNGKYNYINREGKILSSQWFDWCSIFREGFARVKLNDKLNFINGKGKIVSSQWFDVCDNFSEGFARVQLNGKYNYISREGKIISSQWFDWCDNFIEGFARVKLNGKCNFISGEGKILLSQWFDWCGVFIEGFARVELNGKWYKIDRDGSLLSESKKNRRTVYITEEQAKHLNEGILMDSLPDDITNAILQGKTSLKNSPAVPNVFERSYLEKIMNKRFIEVTEELKKIGEINDVPDTDIPTVLNKLILKCQELEKPHRDELEKLCYNYLVDLFAIPDDTVTIDFRLVDEVELNSEVFTLDPVYGEDDEIEYDDLVQVETTNDEVNKRRMLDVLSMGAGMQVSSNIKSYLNDIYDIEPKLADLYRKILALNNYLLLTRENLGMDEDNKLQIGTVEVVLGNENEKPKIIAQGEIFPVLLSECVRGFMELFASHGLPKDRNILQMVLDRADYLKAEPWDMRIGPSLWTIMSESFGDIDFTTIPFVYRRIACLSCKNFNKLMREVLAKTKTGKRYMGKVVEKARKEKEYNQFSDKMSKLKLDKSVITDEFIHPEEL